MQLAVRNLPFCDFVVWTETDIAAERTTMDSTFYMNDSKIEDVKHFCIWDTSRSCGEMVHKKTRSEHWGYSSVSHTYTQCHDGTFL